MTRYILVMLAALAGTAAAQSKLDLTQRYLLLATSKTSTMQKELDEAAAGGYRILVGSTTSSIEMAVLLEKVDDPAGKYKYQLLATTKTSTMQKELDEAAVEGFHIVPSTMIEKKGMLSNEIVLVLEKAPGKGQHYKYMLLATNRTGTMQKEISDAVGKGFKLLGMARGEHVVILEGPAEGGGK